MAIPTPQGDSTRIEMLARSYDDVLAHDRNLDEKVRSLITALAFLAVAGVSLFIFARSGGTAPDLTLDGRSWNAANVFFVCFLAGLILSLMSALVAVDPASHRPSFFAGPPIGEGDPDSPEDSDEDSHRSATTPEASGLVRAPSVLYAGDIARVPNVWRRHAAAAVPEMQRNLVASYGADALDVAQRTSNKERRLGDAQGFIFMAMVTLGYMGLIRLPQSSVDTRTKAIIVAGIALTVLLSPVTVYVMRLDAYLPPRVSRRWPDVLFFYGLPILVVSGSGSYALATHHSYWVAVGTGLVGIFVTTHSSVSRIYSWLKNHSGRISWHVALWLLVAAVIGILAFMYRQAAAPVSMTGSWTRSGDSVDTVVVCARIRGRAYDALRLKLAKDGVFVQGFPRPVELGPTGWGTLTWKSRGAGNFEFQLRRRDTDLKATSLLVGVPERGSGSKDFRCPMPLRGRKFNSFAYRKQAS